MSDKLILTASVKEGEIVWRPVDKRLRIASISLVAEPLGKINDGDVWHAQLVDSTVENRQKHWLVRLVAKDSSIQPWQKIKILEGFYIDEKHLQVLLSWLHNSQDVILVGPAGTGKTQLGFALCETLGWQMPYKVDIYTIQRVTDLFGTDAAADGSTVFRRSGLLEYIERARVAEEQGLDTHFLVILDEINRVHAKANEAMHGLFDATRQVSFTTTEGTKTVILPGNIHFIGTMNRGYQGTYELDDAMQSRFAALQLPAMPEDIEVKMLAQKTEIPGFAAEQIVHICRKLARDSSFSYTPNFRDCEKAASLVKQGVDLHIAIWYGLCGWLDGWETDQKGLPIASPKSEADKALSVLRAFSKDSLRIAN